MARSALALTLLALGLAVSGCGGSDSSEKKPAPSAGAKTTVDTAASRPPKEAKAAQQEAKDKQDERRELSKQRKDDRDFERSFKESPYEQLVGKLPIRKPPLYVEQYITGEGHKLYTAVDRKRFCKLSAPAREKAVASFFKSADRAFRRGSVKDLEQVVTPLSESLEELPALATARGDKVALTKLGRSC